MVKDTEQNPYLKNLDVALKRIGKPRTWLAHECGLSSSSIGNLFSRNSYPAINTAWTISKVLGYPIEDMLKGDIQFFQPAAKSKRDLTTSKINAICKELTEDELEVLQGIVRGIVDFKRLPK